MREPSAPPRSWDPRTRLAALAAAAVAVLIVDNAAPLAAFFGAALIAALAAGGRRRAGWILVLALLTTWGTMLSQGLFYRAMPRTPMLTIELPWSDGVGFARKIVVWREGVVHGVVQALRFNAMTLFGLALCWRIPPQKLLLGLRRLQLPYPVAFMSVAALRFVPTFIEEGRNALRAQHLRGGAFPLFAPHRWPSTLQRYARPVVLRTIRAAGTLALAVQSRAFDPAAPRSEYEEISLRARDIAALGILVAALALLAAAKTATWLYIHGWAAHPVLIPLYAFTRRWL